MKSDWFVILTLNCFCSALLGSSWIQNWNPYYFFFIVNVTATTAATTSVIFLLLLFKVVVIIPEPLSFSLSFVACRLVQDAQVSLIFFWTKPLVYFLQKFKLCISEVISVLRVVQIEILEGISVFLNSRLK